MVIGKGFQEVAKFILSMLITLILTLALFWGLLIWHGSYSCAYQARKMNLVHDYDYFGGCYFIIKGKWVPANIADVCSTLKDKP